MWISKLLTAYNRLANFFLPPYTAVTVSPERLRNEYLVRFLFLVEPMLIIGFLLSSLWTFSPALIIRGLAPLIPLIVLFLLKYGRYKEAIDLLFFGILALAIAGYFSSNYQAVQSIYSPIITITIFIAIALIGLYSGSIKRLVIVSIIGLGFDLVEWVFLCKPESGDWYSHFGVIIFHVLAIGLDRYLMVFFDRISRLAEARRLMNYRLEELLAEIRTEGIARLESFSHDMRSPLTGIIGVHELLEETDLDSTQQKYLRILGRSIRLLMEVVESAMDGSDVSSSTAIAQLLDLSLEPYQAIASRKGLKLRRLVLGDPPALPISRADTIRVISNLVDNALKYTDTGTITVSVARTLDETGRSRWVLSVADTGCGITPERLAEIRGQNVNPDPAVPSSRGLGLANVRRIVVGAGGSLGIESIVGRGTTVILRFPFDQKDD